MTHAQWNARLRQSLAMVQRRPSRALESLEKLVARVQRDEATSVGDWHVDQTLELLSIVQSHLDDHRRAAKTILTVAARHEQRLSYYTRGFVGACATAALELASARDRAGAVRALKRARPLAASLRPPEELFERAERVLAEMPLGHGKSATKRGTSGSRRSTPTAGRRR